MLKVFLLLLGIFALVAAHGSHGHGDENFYEGTDVAVLGEANWDEFLKANPNGFLAEFYAPWCGHCKTMKPAYIEAATKLKAMGISVGAVEATQNQAIAKKFGVDGFPTIMWITGSGQHISHNGGRDVEDLIAFARKQTEPALRSVSTADEVSQLLEENDVVVLARIDSAHEAAIRPVIQAAADHFRAHDGFAFAEITNAEVAAANGMSQAPALKIVNEDGDISFDFFSAEGFTKESMIDFIKKHQLPVLAEINSDNYERYFRQKLPMLWLFCAPETDAEVIAQAKTVAEKFLGKVLFVRLSSKDHAAHAETFGLGGSFPAAVVVDEKLKYPFQGTLNAETLTTFVEGVLGGSVSAHLRSDPVPETQEGPVRVIVGKTIEAEVLNGDKDVLIEFYAPWCGHCQRLAPIFDELAETVANVDDLVIAKMDSTTNDAPAQFDVQGFPTLYFVPKTTHVPVVYEGGRTVEGFLSYLKSHMSSPQKLFLPSEAVKKANKAIRDLEAAAATLRVLVEENNAQAKKIAELSSSKASVPAAQAESHEGHSHDEL